jgi:hypothetical protein
VGEPVVNVTVFVGQPIVVCEGFEKPGCPLAPIFDALDSK